MDSSNPQGPRPRSRGFTLIELMVGLAVGLIATIVIAQVLAVAESQKRSTTSGSDAQVNGAIALYQVARDVQMAGYGISNATRGLGCEIRAKYEGGALMNFALVPLTVTDGADGNPDTVEILMSVNGAYSLPIRIVVDHPRTAANFFTNTTLGVAEGDLMIAVPKTIDADNWCSVLNVTGLGGQGNENGNGGQGGGGAQGQNQVIHNSGNDGVWNQPGGQSIFPDDGYQAGSYLLNLGQMIQRVYRVKNVKPDGTPAHELEHTVSVFTGSAGVAPLTESLFPHIVNLQAYYGKDTNGDGTIDQYDNVQPTNNAEWLQVKAVRMAIVARSAQFEKDVVTAAEPQWDVGNSPPVAGAVDCGDSMCVTLKVDGLPGMDADWNHYRYKVYDTVIPLRNVLWNS